MNVNGYGGQRPWASLCAFRYKEVAITMTWLARFRNLPKWQGWQRLAVRSRFQELVGLDLRSLALFRIVLGLLLLTDLGIRSTALYAHYTDRGLMPISALSDFGEVSIHVFNGSIWFQGALFVIAGLFAGALLVGYHTQLVTLVSWFLLVSLHSRNPLICQGGDVLLRLLLFWGIFLPLGARWSLDSARSTCGAAAQRVVSLGSVALILQVCIVYWFAAASKSDPIWRSEGTAVYYALSLDTFATPLGESLLDYPQLLRFLTFGTVLFEAVAPLLLFIPVCIGPIRLCVVAAFLLFHLFGLALCMELGPFPYVCAAAWLPLLPTWFWEVLGRYWAAEEVAGLMIYHDPRRCSVWKLTLLRSILLLPEVPAIGVADDAPLFPESQLPNGWALEDSAGTVHHGREALRYLLRCSPHAWPLAVLPRWRPATCPATERNPSSATREQSAPAAPVVLWSSVLLNMLAGFFLAYVLLWNLRALDAERFTPYFPRQVNSLGVTLGVAQAWNMFAPPPKQDGWYVIEADLKDGTAVDLLRGGKPVSWEKPPLVSRSYPNERWRKYFDNIHSANLSTYRPYYAAYLADRWNARHHGDQQVESIEIYYLCRDHLPNHQSTPPEKILLYKHCCSAG
jgi:hypothetical protein